MIKVSLDYIRQNLKFIIIGLALCIILWLAIMPAHLFSSRERNQAGDIIPVLASRVERTNVPVEINSIGTVQPTNSVIVKPQVDGRLIALVFRDGQDVREGDILARIDPTLYQAQYEQALAKKKQDEALLANARRDLERYLNLAKTEYAPQQQADTQRALVGQLEAQIAADDGAIESARAYLTYTTITAPISGRTGLRAIDVGNLLKATDTTGIVTINQIQPISVVFTLPQQKLLKIKTAMDQHQLNIDALQDDNTTILDHGHLEVVDNQIDQSTGTVKLKASFPNDRLTLWPGQFVNLRLTVETLSDAITIPTTAVQRGSKGAFVYSVDDQNIAHVKSITYSYQTDQITLIQSGLNEGDRVITNGFNRLTDEAKVRIDEPAQTQIDNGPMPRRQRGERGR
jgi:membrane fusion protein, multidrug efflux system